jgi:hypothetical protein
MPSPFMSLHPSATDDELWSLLTASAVRMLGRISYSLPQVLWTGICGRSLTLSYYATPLIQRLRGLKLVQRGQWGSS